MTTEAKYYTPIVEEFHIGFKYENRLTIEDGWIECIGDWDLLNSAYDDFEHDHENIVELYRVKYLDEADVYSQFDVVAKQMHTIEAHRHYNDPRKEHDIVSVVYNTLSQWMLLYTGKQRDEVEKHTTRFCGTIKNLSEFKAILKQTGCLK